MKKLCILLFSFSFILNAQNNMQFNRVIDTILVVNIPPGINTNTFPLNSAAFSPNSNKVWKISNIITRTFQQPYIVNCSNLTIVSSGGSMFSYVLINDGVNDQPLCSSSSSGNVDEGLSPSFNNFAATSCDDISYPLWINDTSTITLAVNTSYLGDDGLCTTTCDDDTPGACIDPSTAGVASVYISLIEFNIVE